MELGIKTERNGCNVLVNVDVITVENICFLGFPIYFCEVSIVFLIQWKYNA